MSTYHLMVYGAGNSEIAAHLEQEMSKVYALKLRNLKVTAKTYILENSCYSMYKRFRTIETQLQQVKSGGIYNYQYDMNEATMRQQLGMGECSNPAAFEQFLEEGLSAHGGGEVILMLIGENFGNGLFLDYYNNPPTQLTYNDFFNILRRLGREKKVYFHILLDCSCWHSVLLPHQLTHISSVASLYIVERKSPLSVLPIAKVCTGIEKGYEGWQRQLKTEVGGFSVLLDTIGWEICHNQWQLYIKEPSMTTWKLFYDQYKMLVQYHGKNKGGVIRPLQNTYETDLVKDGVVRAESLAIYFQSQYNETPDEEVIEEWLSEMNKCISYYKM